MKNFKLKKQIVEGIRVGLVAFIICYICSLVISIIFNISVLQKLNDLVQGALSDKVGIGFSSIVKVTSIIMNFSVFNTIGEIRFGVLLLVVIPCISFLLADRKDNTKEGLDLNNIILYLTSSIIFSILLSILSVATRGFILDINVDFFSIRNIFTTILVTLLIQVVIGMNYNKNNISGIKAARIMTRLTLGIGAVLGLIILIVLLNGQISSIFGRLLIIIIMLPNIAIYIMFLLMGINISISEPLLKLINFANDNVMISFGDLPIWLRVISITTFFIIICASLLFIKKQKYLKDLGVFALTFSAFTTLAAFCTTINLGMVKNIVDVKFGINLMQAFLIPFIMIIIIGLIIFLVRKVFSIIKEV